MKKKTTNVKADKVPPENPSQKAIDEMEKRALSLPVHKSKLLISEKELKEEMRKI